MSNDVLKYLVKKEIGDIDPHFGKEVETKNSFINS